MNNRIEEKIYNLLENDLDNLLKVSLQQDIEKKLLPYQILHVHNLINVININRVALDGSDTGTGKTYAAVALCKQMKLIPFVICPKSVISNWLHVCKYFGVKPLSITNYDLAIRKRYIVDQIRKDCPYIKSNNNPKFKWLLPKNSLLIFDEVHRCKDANTLHYNLLLASIMSKHKILMLSATVADVPEKFKIFGYALNLYNDMKQSKNWLQYNRKIKDIHNQIYPKKGSRIRIGELGEMFPKNQITAECYDVDDADIINKNYDTIEKAHDDLRKKSKHDKKNALVDLMRARQEIEYNKINIIVDMVEDYRANYSIVIFVNFIKTLELLSKILNTNCLIHGDQTAKERDNTIQNFMDNKEKIIICNIKAGGHSISLHDIHGTHPRISIISPSFSSTELKQSLGRIHRAEGKSPALQRIIFCANTVEETISKNITKKLNFLSEINDGDMTGDLNFIQTE